MFEISVVIPAYNNADTIIDALESVRKQTTIDCIFQIIVVDDGSKDGTFDIVKEYALSNQELPIEIIRQKNKGASCARNEGMKRAKGNWIAFLDADDEWRENRLSRQIDVIRANPQIDFLGASFNDKPLNILGKRVNSLYKASVRDLIIKFFPCTPSVLMRRSIFDEIGGFNELWKYAEDGEYFIRICTRYNYYYLPEHLIDIGHGKRAFGEKGLSANLRGMYEGNINILRELKDNRIISAFEYGLFRAFYFMKFIRRIIISRAYNTR